MKLVRNTLLITDNVEEWNDEIITVESRMPINLEVYKKINHIFEHVINHLGRKLRNHEVNSKRNIQSKRYL